MIRMHSNAGVGYSVVDLGGVPHVFASAVPRNGGSLEEQVLDALSTIKDLSEEQGTLGSIVMQAVFMQDINDVAACREIIDRFYGADLPATSYIPQPPCGGKRVAIEALGVGRKRGGVQIERFGENMVVTRHAGIAWMHVADIWPQTPSPATYDRSLDGFRQMRDRLASQGVKFEQVIRTWLYLGDIVGPEGDTQRYKELNRARTDFYADIPFGVGHKPQGWDKAFYPASTGIGTGGQDVTMSCIALLSDRPDVLCVPLENPQQTAACEYAHQYGPQSPKFARAMVVATGDAATTFVSGTASITASETRHLDDLQGQTQQTWDNIEALIGEDNFRGHGLPGLGAALDDLALVRVYIKREEDYPVVRMNCETRLGEVPTIYAIGDVCRPELLVEIEGIAFSRRRG
jgi:enamine deaminase RidA (YjgF/YER057c/UK114 family)